MRRRSMLGIIGAAGATGVATLAGATSAGGTTEAERLYGQPWDHDAERANNAGLGLGDHARVGSGQMVWSVETDRRALALTFDDGPDPRITGAVLDALGAVGATATFMMMGWNAHKHPELVHRVVDAGHEVGCHGWSHLDLAQCSVEQVEREIAKGKDAVEQAAGAAVRWYRPPRGVITGRAMRVAVEHQLDLAMWSLTASVRGEPQDVASTDIADHILGNAVQGDIVCLHDGIGRGTFGDDARFRDTLLLKRRTELGALPDVLVGLRRLALEPVGLSELVRTASTDR